MQRKFTNILSRTSWLHFSTNKQYQPIISSLNYLNRYQFSSSSFNSSNNLPLSQVVKIHCTRSSPDRNQQWQNKSQRHGTGSGFLISNKRILTNAHVVANNNFVTITKHNSGTHYVANVISIM